MDNAAFAGVIMGLAVPFIRQLCPAAVSGCGNSGTALAALDDADGDMTKIYGWHLLSVRGYSGSVEPDRREAGVWLSGAHKGFGECSAPSRTKYATAPGRAHDTGNGV